MRVGYVCIGRGCPYNKQKEKTMNTMTDLRLQVNRIHRFEGEGHLKAFVDVSIEGKMLIKGVRIVAGNKGIFVSMPQERGKDGKWYEQVQFLDDGFKRQMTETILEEYEKK
jgi:stage V sporulation protein G